jgi:hypothetical protein
MNNAKTNNDAGTIVIGNTSADSILHNLAARTLFRKAVSKAGWNGTIRWDARVSGVKCSNESAKKALFDGSMELQRILIKNITEVENAKA